MAGSQKRNRNFRHVGHFNSQEQDLFLKKYAAWQGSAQAAQYGGSVSAYLRYATIGAGAQKLRKRRSISRYQLPAEKALLQLKAEVNRVGNNFNQIAYQYNIGNNPAPAYIQQALSDWQAITKAINAHLGINP